MMFYQQFEFRAVRNVDKMEMRTKETICHGRIQPSFPRFYLRSHFSLKCYAASCCSCASSFHLFKTLDFSKGYFGPGAFFLPALFDSDSKVVQKNANLVRIFEIVFFLPGAS